MIREPRDWSRQAAVIGAVLLALGLSGCGRIGPLDLPPGAAIDQSANPKPAIGPDGKPIAPSGEKKPLPIDWLLN